MACRNPKAPRMAAAKTCGPVLEASRRIARNVFLRRAPQASRGVIGLDICFVRAISVGALIASGIHKLRMDERAVKEQPCVVMTPLPYQLARPHARREFEVRLSMNRPLTPSLSPSEGERVRGGRVRGWFMVPMHAKNERGLSMNRSVCGADWQSAVSRVANPLVAPIHSHARRLPIGETADYQSALLDGHGSWRRFASKFWRFLLAFTPATRPIGFEQSLNHARSYAKSGFSDPGRLHEPGGCRRANFICCSIGFIPGSSSHLKHRYWFGHVDAQHRQYVELRHQLYQPGGGLSSRAHSRPGGAWHQRLGAFPIDECADRHPVGRAAGNDDPVDRCASGRSEQRSALREY